MAMQVKRFQGKTACLGKKPTALHITGLRGHCGTKRARISYSAKWWRFALRRVLDFGGKSPATRTRVRLGACAGAVRKACCDFEFIAQNGKEADFERAGKAGGSL